MKIEEREREVMVLQRGKGHLAVPLLAAAIASAANAALVTFTTAVTNNTTEDKIFDFSTVLELTSSLGNTGGSGSLVIVVSDIRGGGAYVKGVGLTPIYTGHVKDSLVAQMGTGTEISQFVLTAGSHGQATYSRTFSTENFGVNADVNDTIDMDLKFILSAGDQAVIAGTFEVDSFNNAPAPGALALVMVAGGVGLRGRRRTYN